MSVLNLLGADDGETLLIGIFYSMRQSRGLGKWRFGFDDTVFTGGADEVGIKFGDAKKLG